ncbi:MAG: hypothetical protein ACJ8GN_19875 [Longimicrobiaceae bacterium]
MPSFPSFLLPAAAASFLAVAAHAQTPAPRVSAIATAGYLHPVQDLRPVSTGTPAGVRLEGAPQVGLAAQVRTPLPLDVRVALSAAWPTLRVAATSEESSTSRSAVTFAGVDLVVHGPGLGPLTTHLLLGGGVKHYDFDQRALSGGAAVDYARDVTDPTLHLGLGVGYAFRRHGMLLEVSDYESSFDRKTSGPGGTSAPAPSQHDLVVSMGVRVRIR